MENFSHEAASVAKDAVDFVRKFLGPKGWEAFCRQIWETEIKPALELRSSAPLKEVPGPEANTPPPPQLGPAPQQHDFVGRVKPVKRIHPLEFPPPLSSAELAWTPTRLRSIPRNHEAIALRRELIAEALKAAKVVTSAEIVAHLREAKFPVDDPYYTKEMYPGKARLQFSIYNDLAYFAKRKWVRQISREKWHWLRPVTPPKVSQE